MSSYLKLTEKIMVEAIHNQDKTLTPRFIREVLPEVKDREPYALISSHFGILILDNKAPRVIIVASRDIAKQDITGKFPGTEDEALLREHNLEGVFDEYDYRLLAGPSDKTPYDLLKDFDLQPGDVRFIKISS